MTFAEIIVKYRKELGLTQEGLAQKLGVTNQAVSKWESGQSCPDIALLPVLADLFGITLDQLFGREPKAVAVPRSLGWPDDGVLRVILYAGHQQITAPTETTEATEPPPVDTNPLTGEALEAVTDNRPYAIMINNTAKVLFT